MKKQQISKIKEKVNDSKPLIIIFVNTSVIGSLHNGIVYTDKPEENQLSISISSETCLFFEVGSSITIQFGTLFDLVELEKSINSSLHWKIEGENGNLVLTLVSDSFQVDLSPKEIIKIQNIAVNPDFKQPALNATVTLKNIMGLPSVYFTSFNILTAKYLEKPVPLEHFNFTWIPVNGNENNVDISGDKQNLLENTLEFKITNNTGKDLNTKNVSFTLYFVLSDETGLQDNSLTTTTLAKDICFDKKNGDGWSVPKKLDPVSLQLALIPPDIFKNNTSLEITITAIKVPPGMPEGNTTMYLVYSGICSDTDTYQADYFSPDINRQEPVPGIKKFFVYPTTIQWGEKVNLSWVTYAASKVVLSMSGTTQIYSSDSKDPEFKINLNEYKFLLEPDNDVEYTLNSFDEKGILIQDQNNQKSVSVIQPAGVITSFSSSDIYVKNTDLPKTITLNWVAGNYISLMLFKDDDCKNPLYTENKTVYGENKGSLTVNITQSTTYTLQIIGTDYDPLVKRDVINKTLKVTLVGLVNIRDTGILIQNGGGVVYNGKYLAFNDSGNIYLFSPDDFSSLGTITFDPYPMKPYDSKITPNISAIYGQTDKFVVFTRYAYALEVEEKYPPIFKLVNINTKTVSDVFNLYILVLFLCKRIVENEQTKQLLLYFMRDCDYSPTIFSLDIFNPVKGISGINFPTDFNMDTSGDSHFPSISGNFLASPDGKKLYTVTGVLGATGTLFQILNIESGTIIYSEKTPGDKLYIDVTLNQQNNRFYMLCDIGNGGCAYEIQVREVANPGNIIYTIDLPQDSRIPQGQFNLGLRLNITDDGKRLFISTQSRKPDYSYTIYTIAGDLLPE